MSEITSNDSTNPFSKEALHKLQISQDFPSMSAVKPLLISVQCRKPSREEFIRVRSGQDNRFRCMCHCDKDSNAMYIVNYDVKDLLRDFIKRTELVICVSRNSTVPFIWPLSLPNSDQVNPWHSSAIEAAQIAESKWVQVKSDTTAGRYVVSTPISDFADPNWSDIPDRDKLLELCFKDRVIQTANHPIAKKLRGEL
jgi:hypothetical protein